VSIEIRMIDKPEDMVGVEELQRLVWSGNETEIVPVHVLITAAHNGGLLLGAYLSSPEVQKERLIGFVFGFPGMYPTPDGPRLKHCSHMLAVHPDYRDLGLGFSLKRAQWQMVRNQGLDRITWTYDPLQSRNANLNIAKLGAVCNTYLLNVYGELRDGINVGLPSDRFQVDWWVNSTRVNRRLSRTARQRLDLAHYYAAGAEVINPTRLDKKGLPRPVDIDAQQFIPATEIDPPGMEDLSAEPVKPILLVEIPADIQQIKAADPELSLAWRMHTRKIFSDLFQSGYYVTDFVHLKGTPARSFYVLSYGESTL